MGLLSSLFKVTRLPAALISGILGFPETVVSAAMSLPCLSWPQLLFYGAIGAFVFSVIVPKYCKNLSEFRDCLREFLILLDSKKSTPEPEPAPQPEPEPAPQPEPEPAPQPAPEPEPPKLKQVLRDVPLKPIESTPRCEENKKYECPPTPMGPAGRVRGNLFKGYECHMCKDYFAVPLSDNPEDVYDYRCKSCGTRYKFDHNGEQF